MTVFFELPASVYLKILIAFIAVIIFSRWLAKKMINAGKSKAYTNNAKTLIYSGFAYVAFVWLVFNVITYERQTKFNQDKWMAEKNKRYEMAADLIQSGIVAGKDSIEVKSLIGEPDLRNVASQIWNYNMGEGGGGFGFTLHYLLVEFKGDTVSHVLHHEIVD